MAFNAQQLIALKSIPNCGLKTVKNIADYVVNESVNGSVEFAEIVNESIARKIDFRLKKKISIEEARDYIVKAEQILEMSERLGIKTITYQDSLFPKMLLKTVDEKGFYNIPVILHYKGDLSVSDMPGIAVIGTRKPSREGIYAGKRIGEIFAERGFNVVSGLALGCDTAGHQGALSVEGGKTTAFLAHALDMVYPSENKDLAEDIINRGGLLMSEYAIDDDFKKYNFIARDRLQSALSKATIIIQTDERGGAIHAARTTMISGKPIFCMDFPTLKGRKIIGGNELLVTSGLEVPVINRKDSSIIRHADRITLATALDIVKGKL